MSDVTQILSQIEQGNSQAAEQLLPLVYDELRKLAAARLSHEKPGQTLQATALVHEAYLRLVGGTGAPVESRKSKVEGQESERDDPTFDIRHSTVGQFSSRGHFFAAAAEAMRRILVEQARRRKSLKAGGQFEQIEWSEIAAEPSEARLDLIALDEALQKLEAQNPRKAQLVKLRYFAGLTLEQAAEALSVAPSTASADWLYAKSWLRLELQSPSPPGRG